MTRPDPPPEPMPWDRIGSFCEDLFTVSRTMASRNLGVWSSLSQNLRKEQYKADDLSNDAAKTAAAAMANVQDVWDLWIRFPERERVAATAPTAFLLFTPFQIGEQTQWSCEDSIWLRVANSVVERDPSVYLELNGPDDATADRLVDSLAIERGPSRQAFRLYTHDLKRHAVDLEPGVYTGSIYVKEPTVLLVANLRIVVESGSNEPQPRRPRPPEA